MFFELLLLLVSLLAYALYKVKQKQETYWQSMGVKCPPNKFPLGSTPDYCADVLLGKRNINEVVTEQYELMKGEKFYGTYQVSNPVLALKDPELIKQILVKDFNHFVDRVGESAQKLISGNTKTDKIWANMLATSGGDTWKNARSTFSPIFTSGKMKSMLTLMHQVNDRLISSFDAAAQNGEEIDLKEKFGKFSMDTIALCAFGMDAQSFTNPNSEFVKHARNIFRRDTVGIIKAMLAVFIPGGHQLLQALQIPIFKPTETSFFDKVLEVTLQERRKSNVRRNDLIDLMLDAMKDSAENDKEDEEEDEDTKLVHKANKRDLSDITIVSTALIMLVAGYDTTAQTLSYTTYELAMNPDIQKRLQDEIDDALDGKLDQHLDYTKIQSMQYLDMVFHETLRLHPAVGTFQRACVDEYTIPGTNIKLKKGSEVFINVSGIHSDPEYYPEPEKFDPEHFSKEGKAARHPFTFLGFGQGPRGCIGMRFAILEAKIALISLLAKYNVVKSPKTVEKVKLDPASILGASKDGLYIKLVPRN